MAGSRYLRKLDPTRVQLGQGSPHFRRDDLVCFAVKDANLRDLILRENRFQRNQVVEPVPEKAPKRDGDLCSDHILHGGEGRKHQNFADGVFGCELEGGSDEVLCGAYTTSLIMAFCAAIDFGVNPRETRPRSRVWSGGSMTWKLGCGRAPPRAGARDVSPLWPWSCNC